MVIHGPHPTCFAPHGFQLSVFENLSEFCLSVICPESIQFHDIVIIVTVSHNVWAAEHKSSRNAVQFPRLARRQDLLPWCHRTGRFIILIQFFFVKIHSTMCLFHPAPSTGNRNAISDTNLEPPAATAGVPHLAWVVWMIDQWTCSFPQNFPGKRGFSMVWCLKPLSSWYLIGTFQGINDTLASDPQHWGLHLRCFPRGVNCVSWRWSLGSVFKFGSFTVLQNLSIS